jgi:putative NADPH-quinone reductase
MIVEQDRKQIIKVIKLHVERMCTDDEAQLVLFTALDVIEFVFPVYWLSVDES